jgi:hypothetical protein
MKLSANCPDCGKSFSIGKCIFMLDPRKFTCSQCKAKFGLKKPTGFGYSFPVLMQPRKFGGGGKPHRG